MNELNTGNSKIVSNLWIFEREEKCDPIHNTQDTSTINIRNKTTIGLEACYLNKCSFTLKISHKIMKPYL